EIGTVLPFSAISGATSVSLPPVWGVAPPANSAMRFSVSSTEASAGVAGKPAAKAAAPAARPSAWRLLMSIRILLFLEGGEIGHRILYLLRGEDRLPDEVLTHVYPDVERVEARHHCL